jgi:putative transposase
MSREVHVRFCEGPEVRSLRPTHPYVRLDEAFVYPAVMLAAFSRKVIGCAMEDHLWAELALAALERAIRRQQITRVG